MKVTLIREEAWRQSPDTIEIVLVEKRRVRSSSSPSDEQRILD